MGQRRRDKKQRKLTQQTTSAIFATAGANQAATTQQMAMQAEQLRIAQMQAAEAQAAAALAQQQAAQRAVGIAANAAEAPGWRPDPIHTHELRWWGGVSWTDQVMDGGVQATDPDFGDDLNADPTGTPAIGPGAAALPASTDITAVAGTPSVAQQIRELGELKDQGLLTEEEFVAQKARILG